MSREEFKMFIETIGFEYAVSFNNIERHDIYNDRYNYKEYRIELYNNYYEFYNGSEWVYDIDLNDLTPLKQIERSYKLKKILG